MSKIKDNLPDQCGFYLDSFESVDNKRWQLCQINDPSGPDGDFSLVAYSPERSSNRARFVAHRLTQFNNNSDAEGQYALQLNGLDGQFLGGSTGPANLNLSNTGVQFNIIVTDDSPLNDDDPAFVGIIQFEYMDEAGIIHHLYPTFGTNSGNTATVEWSEWIGLGSGRGSFPGNTPPKQKWVFIKGTGLTEG